MLLQLIMKTFCLLIKTSQGLKSSENKTDSLRIWWNPANCNIFIQQWRRTREEELKVGELTSGTGSRRAQHTGNWRDEVPHQGTKKK